MVWTVPAVQTLAGPAFAAGTACVPDLVLSITVDGTRTCISKTTYNDPSGGTPGQCCDCYTTVLPGVIDAIGTDGAGPLAVALCQLQGDCVATTTGC